MSTKVVEPERSVRRQQRRNACSRARYAKLTPEQRKEHNKACKLRKKKTLALRPERKALELKQKRIARRKAGPISAQTLTFLSQETHCAYCLKPEAREIEHCTPISRGGTNDPTNLVMACRPCNVAKGSKTVLEYCLGLKSR